VRAVNIHRFGGPEVLLVEDVPRPQPAQGEVLIRVRAAGLNPVDWKTRSGRGVARSQAIAFPYIPGWDVSGVVEEVSGGAVAFRPGDEVFGMVRFPQIGSACAETCAAPAAHLALKPRSLDHVEAAALPLVALTAWQALFEAARLEGGQRVVIHAAAGGVGHVAVQLARWKGAHVTGTASGRNGDFVRQLGADVCVDYETTCFEDVARDADVVLDSLAGETRDRSWQVLKPGGMLVSILGEPDAGDAARHGVRSAAVLVRPDAAQLTEIAALADAGHLRPAVSAVFPLEDVRAAFERVESGHTRGKVVLRVG
jgi:NADPH:quinone reductase-like Zn-dependent oxidoreductase